MSSTPNPWSETPAEGPRRDPQSQPGETRYRPPAAGPEGVVAPTPTATSGPIFCWQCERYAVDHDGDLCDLCLDAVGDELADRIIGSGW